MIMDETKRKKLRDLLGAIGTPEDLQEVDASYAARKAITDRFDTIAEKLGDVSSAEDVKALSKELQDASQKTKTDLAKMAKETARTYAESISEFKDSLTEELKKLGSTITTSYEQNKPKNAAGVYKDMINQLAIIDKSINDKPVPVWNWPQYAGVSVRDTNFANINPSIAPFNITAQYDEVQLSDYDVSGNVGTVTYLTHGVVAAVLSLTYDGSGNLTDAVRTS